MKNCVKALAKAAPEEPLFGISNRFNEIFNFKYHLISIIRISSFTILFISMVYSVENYLSIDWLEKIILNVIGGGIIGLFLKVINWDQFYSLLKHDKSS